MLTLFTQRSLRRMLTLTGVAVAATAVFITAGALIATSRLDGINERDDKAFADEQSIADRITALAYQQQLDAYRFLITPDTALIRRFDLKGDVAEAEMHRYLFHSLPELARLQVERMKEAHQAFEVVAHRVFELASQGDTALARQRLAQLDADVAQFDGAVRTFLQTRLAQHDALGQENRNLTQQVRVVLIAAGVALLLLAVGLAREVAKRVLVPLEEVIRTTESLRAGDAAARVPLQEYDELKTVASAFNDMAAEMQTSRETVEMQNEQLRESLDQLHNAQDELVLRERLGAMGEMLAGVAHELNNPLGSVLGLAEVLSVELSSSTHPDVLHLETSVVSPLVHEARRARELVRNLLNFARRPVDALDSVPLAVIVSSAVTRCQPAFDAAGKTIHLDVSPDLYVRADAQKLEQVILNVATNALDAIIEGDGTILTISARSDDSRVTMLAEDDGTGFIDPVAAFKPFYTTKPAEHGTGLGLALVQKFVHEFGGTVTLSNRRERGAQITMVLSRGSAAAARLAKPSTETPQRSATPVTSTPGTAASRAPLVLVVDDEPTLLAVQRRMLEMIGVTSVLASNGAEARDMIERDPPDLVISDLRMPGELDGRALMKWLGAAHPDLARHALLVTGEMERDGDDAAPLPADRIIRKPFTLSEYQERVISALRAAGK